jgi:predicted enzyme related to lactoylglutathione lyase
MATRTSYLQGTPNWVDLQTNDQDGAKAFYGNLFGWSYDDQPMPQGPAYSLAKLGDGTVAAIAPQSPDMQAAGVPPAWNTYLAVDSADDAAARVEPAGGTVTMQPFDVMDAGRMTFVLDPTGVAVGLWQAGQHIGATVVNEPGTVIWNELVTDDQAAALPFYEAVVGLTTTRMDMPGGGPYTVFEAGDQQVGGSMSPPTSDVPNHWQVYFAVTDADASARTAGGLGGSVVMAPFDTSVGRMAVLRDPQGGTFSIIQPAPPEQQQ